MEFGVRNVIFFDIREHAESIAARTHRNPNGLTDGFRKLLLETAGRTQAAVSEAAI